jgi:hypothetical protein
VNIWETLARKHAISEEAVRLIARGLLGVDCRYLSADEAEQLSRRIRRIKNDPQE